MSAGMLSRETRNWLVRTQGLIENAQGERLAELAYYVPRNMAIVEIGSHTGLSTCWLAAGSRAGNGAHVTAVDPYPDPRPGSKDDPWELGPDGVMERFFGNIAGTTQNVKREDYGDLVTLMRGESTTVAKLWTHPIGLLFVDAIHEEWAVKADYAAWERFMPSGSFIAFHDWHHSYPGCKAAIDVVAANGEWEFGGNTGSLWTGVRL